MSKGNAECLLLHHPRGDFPPRSGDFPSHWFLHMFRHEQTTLDETQGQVADVVEGGKAGKDGAPPDEFPTQPLHAVSVWMGQSLQREKNQDPSRHVCTLFEAGGTSCVRRRPYKKALFSSLTISNSNLTVVAFLPLHPPPHPPPALDSPFTFPALDLVPGSPIKSITSG